MATSVEVPPLGESVKQAILIKWHKADGESVGMDEPICELETDKANVDVTASASGVLRRIRQEGDTVGVGEAIARIDEGGAAKPKAAAAAQAGGSTAMPRRRVRRPRWQKRLPRRDRRRRRRLRPPSSKT